MRHRGKTAVVIGGTHGMGLAMARLMRDEGARVLVTGNNELNVREAERILGDGARALRSDAADLDAIARLAAAVSDQLGMLDAVFVNLGISELEPFECVTEASFDRQFTINVKGAFFTAQKLAPLVRRGGAIVFTTVTPATATPTMAVYAATKAAVRSFARGFAAELVTRGVRVNAVAPGFIDTPTLGVASATPEQRRALAAIGDVVTPMKRHGHSEEVARAAVFLAFEATFTTGVELAVDGGLSTIDAPQPGSSETTSSEGEAS